MNKQQGSAHVIIAISLLVIVIVGFLGFIFWKNFINKNDTSSSVKRDNEWCVMSEDGSDETLGCYKTEAEAEARSRQLSELSDKEIKDLPGGTEENPLSGEGAKTATDRAYILEYHAKTRDFHDRRGSNGQLDIATPPPGCSAGDDDCALKKYNAWGGADVLMHQARRYCNFLDQGVSKSELIDSLMVSDENSSTERTREFTATVNEDLRTAVNLAIKYYCPEY